MLPSRCRVASNSTLHLNQGLSNNYCNARTPFAIHEILGLAGGSFSNQSLTSQEEQSNITTQAQVSCVPSSYVMPSSYSYCQTGFLDSPSNQLLRNSASSMFPLDPALIATQATSFDYGNAVNNACNDGKETFYFNE